MNHTPLTEGTVVHATYRLTRLLGQGGMGAVWEAEHMRLPKQVAIKFLLGAGDGSVEMAARFRREAEIASRLAHPQIVEVHDFNTLEDGTPYLVMERLRGRDLRAVLDDGPLPLERARQILLYIASALTVAHRAGVVHRDLKPENIFLCDSPDAEPRVKVLDFGISKIQDSTTLATLDDRILGTPGYMAPEQVMGRNSLIDARTDLFSLAALFYEMLTGENVFVGSTLAEVVYKVVHHSPEPLSSVKPEVPAMVSSAVERAMSKEQGARHESVQAFVDSMTAPEAAAIEAPVDVGAATISGQAASASAAVPAAEEVPRDVSPPRTRSWRWAFVGAALALACMAVVAWQWLPRSTRPRPAHSRDTPRSAEVAEPEAPAVQPAKLPPGDETRSNAAAVDAAVDAQTLPKAAVVQVADTEAKSRRRPAHRRQSPADPPIPDSVRKALVRAENALRAGNYADALRLARGSLYEQKTPDAFAIMARAYCRQKDVGNAAAMLRSLQGAAARAVRKECAKHGVELGR